MAIYLIFLILCMMLTWLYDHAKPYHKEVKWGILFFLVIFLFMGLRYGVGQDYWWAYIPIWEEVAQTGWAQNVEPGYVLFNEFLQLFTDDYAVLFFIIAFVFTFFIYKSIKQYKMSMFLAAFVFIAGGFYLYSWNVMRQCLVTAVFYYTLKYVRQKKFIPFFFLNFACFFIHKSALLYIPVYFVLNRNFKFKTYLIWTLIFMALRVIILPLLSFFLQGTKWGNYVNGTYADPSANKLTVSQLINIFMFFVFCYYTPWGYKDRKFLVFKNLHFLGLLSSLFMGVVPLVFRITTMFYLVSFLSVPYIVSRYVTKEWRSYVTVGVLLIYGVLFVHSLMNNGNNVIPYQFIWQRG